MTPCRDLINVSKAALLFYPIPSLLFSFLLSYAFFSSLLIAICLIITRRFSITSFSYSIFYANHKVWFAYSCIYSFSNLLSPLFFSFSFSPLIFTSRPRLGRGSFFHVLKRQKMEQPSSSSTALPPPTPLPTDEMQRQGKREKARSVGRSVGWSVCDLGQLLSHF